MLSQQSKLKFPYSNLYVNKLQKSGMNEEYIGKEINSLNECAICEEPFSIPKRLGIATLSSLTPFGLFGGICGYLASGDQCHTEYRQAQYRYESFEEEYSKL